MTAEYRALVDKVTAFAQGVRTELSDAMVCAAGCDGCCQVWLAPCVVESDVLRAAVVALPPARRRELAARARGELAREARHEPLPRCAMLDADGRCAVYDARPLVCRTQGLALRYPRDVIPAAAVRKRLPDGGEVGACALNFTRGMPRSGDTLDAERTDRLLALVNLRYCTARGLDAQRRTPISAIAAQGDVLGCDGPQDDRNPNGSARNDDSR